MKVIIKFASDYSKWSNPSLAKLCSGLIKSSDVNKELRVTNAKEFDSLGKLFGVLLNEKKYSVKSLYNKLKDAAKLGGLDNCNIADLILGGGKNWNLALARSAVNKARANILRDSELGNFYDFTEGLDKIEVVNTAILKGASKADLKLIKDSDLPPYIIEYYESFLMSNKSVNLKDYLKYMDPKIDSRCMDSVSRLLKDKKVPYFYTLWYHYYDKDSGNPKGGDLFVDVSDRDLSKDFEIDTKKLSDKDYPRELIDEFNMSVDEDYDVVIEMAGPFKNFNDAYLLKSESQSNLRRNRR